MTRDNDDEMRDAIVITDPDMVQLASLQALKGALRLELKGMRLSRGQSAAQIVRRRFGWKGTKAHLLDKLIQHIREEEKKHGIERGAE